MSTWDDIKEQTEKAKKYLNEERYLYGNDLGNRVALAETALIEQVHCTEVFDKAFRRLAEKNDHTTSLLKEAKQQLKESIDRCSLYQRIAKERAQRQRKNVSDPSGYAFVASREIIDYYDKTITNGRKERIPIVAYKTTLSMPYPPQLGFSELRRLLEVDLVGNGAALIWSKDTVREDGIGSRIGIHRISEGLPADGKHPGPLEETGWDPETCILYRVILNIGKKFPEADLYTTQPLDIPVEMMVEQRSPASRDTGDNNAYPRQLDLVLPERL